MNKISDLFNIGDKVWIKSLKKEGIVLGWTAEFWPHPKTSYTIKYESSIPGDFDIGDFEDCILNYTTKSETKECPHEWKNYNGFTSTYDYCIKCDLKK